MIELMDVLNALEKSFRVLFPNVKRVHLERIQSIKEPAISVELITYSTPIVSENIIEKQIDLDIIYFSENNKVREGIAFADRLKDLLGLGLKVKDRFIKIAEPPEIKLIEQDLHFLVTFEFADEYRPVTVEGGKVIEISQGTTDITNAENEKEVYPEDDIEIHKDKLEFMENIYMNYEI